MKKRQLVLFAVIFLGLLIVFQKGREWHYVHDVGLGGNSVKMAEEEPTSVFLPLGYVLYFVDKHDQVGYIYLTASKYGEAAYVFGLYKDDRLAEQRGRFTIWGVLSFLRRSANAVYGDDTHVPYFTWIETGWLLFAFGNIDRVSVARLPELNNGDISPSQYNWIKAGTPTCCLVGRQGQ